MLENQTFLTSFKIKGFFVLFPGKGGGPGFSFSFPFGVLGVWRGSEQGRRINFTVFLRV